MEDSAVNPGIFIVIFRFWSCWYRKTAPALSLVTDRRTERLTFMQARRLQPYRQSIAVVVAIQLSRQAKEVQAAYYLRPDTRAVRERSTSRLIVAAILECEFGLKSGHIHEVHPFVLASSYGIGGRLAFGRTSRQSLIGFAPLYSQRWVTGFQIPNPVFEHCIHGNLFIGRHTSFDKQYIGVGM